MTTIARPTKPSPKFRTRPPELEPSFGPPTTRRGRGRPAAAAASTASRLERPPALARVGFMLVRRPARDHRCPRRARHRRRPRRTRRTRHRRPCPSRRRPARRRPHRPRLSAHRQRRACRRPERPLRDSRRPPRPDGGGAHQGTRRRGRALSAESTPSAPNGPSGSSGAAQARPRPSTLRPNAARTVSASSFGRMPRARAGSHLKPARIAIGDCHGVRSSAGGAIGARRTHSRPSSSRISPERAPESAGPRRTTGGSGGGPASGPRRERTGRRRHRPPTARPATSHRRGWRPAHARPGLLVADADRQLSRGTTGRAVAGGPARGRGSRWAASAPAAFRLPEPSGRRDGGRPAPRPGRVLRQAAAAASASARAPRRRARDPLGLELERVGARNASAPEIQDRSRLRRGRSHRPSAATATSIVVTPGRRPRLGR